jgi:S-adenosyl-L-methionine hydrolase (adenosine-forming)
MRPIVGLVTDFGQQDHYVGATKGAILAACPEAQLVDIVHDLPPHDVEAASLSLGASYRAFPGGTVFLAVVDPGVGSDRRALALEAGGYRFVGPDNGIFTDVLLEHPDARIHQVTNSGLFRHEVSATFHARDVFGPVAGRLASGMPLDETGPRIEDAVRLPRASVRQVGEREWETVVAAIDRFGNLTTGLGRADWEHILAGAAGDPTELVVVVEGAVLPIVRTYSDVPEGEACALLGSSGRLEVAVRAGSAARVLGAARGASVRVRALSYE